MVTLRIRVRPVSRLCTCWFSVSITDIVASASGHSFAMTLKSNTLLLKRQLGNIVLVSKPSSKFPFPWTRWSCRGCIIGGWHDEGALVSRGAETGKA